MKTILMTADSYLPRLGGGEYHVYYLARELRKLGYGVRILVTEPGEHSDDAELQVTRVAYCGWRSIPGIFRTAWQMAQGVDVIHCHYSYRLACLAATVAFIRRKQCIVTQHGLGLLPQAGATFWQTIPFSIWRWWSMWCAQVIISTSEDLSLDIRRLGFGQKIVPISNGYDSQRFVSLPARALDDHPTLLTVRRLVPKNGIQFLLAALPEVRRVFPGLRYRCVGDGRLREALQGMAKGLGVDDCIDWLGSLDHESVLAEYQRCHIVIQPSTAESTSLACLEAMAVGRPVIANRVGGLVELLGQHGERGTLVPLTDEHCNYDAPMTLPPQVLSRLSSAIIDCLLNYARANEVAAHSSRWVAERFSWSRIAEQTVLTYFRSDFAHTNPVVESNR